MSKDHWRVVPVRNIVFPAQDLLDGATNGCWTLDVHRAPRAGWWAVTVSYCRPPGCKPGALPAELTAPPKMRDKAPARHLPSGNSKAEPLKRGTPPQKRSLSSRG